MFNNLYRGFSTTILLLAFMVVLSSVLTRAQESALRFDTSDHGEPGNRAPVIQPWKTIEIDPEYGGQWIVTGDIDGDGEIEIVSARNVNLNDVHYTSAVSRRNWTAR